MIKQDLYQYNYFVTGAEFIMPIATMIDESTLVLTVHIQRQRISINTHSDIILTHSKKLT